MLKTITANGTETRQLAEDDIRHPERPFCVMRRNEGATAAITWTF
jgi:hypothetical protein